MHIFFRVRSVLLGFFAALLFSPLTTHAQNNLFFQGASFCDYMRNVFNFATVAVGTVTIVMVIVGGLAYATSAGNPERLKSSKDIIVSAIAGMVIALGAYLIFQTIAPNVLNCKSPQLPSVGSTTTTNTNTTAPPLAPGEFRNVTTYRQNRSPYRDYPYRAAGCTYNPPNVSYSKTLLKGTLGSAGCGPTAMAMALSAYGVNVDPKQVGDHFVSIGARGCDGGTRYAGMTNGPNKWGYKGTTSSYDSAVKAASQGKVVVALAVNSKRKSTSNNYFTKGGHFIVLSAHKDGKFRVNNPWAGGKEGWIDQKIINDNVTTYWVIDKK